MIRRAAAALTVLLAVLGVAVVLPGAGGTAYACSCAVSPSERIPPGRVVIHGIVEKQRVGFRDVDVQVRVTSMYGAAPERTTVIRALSDNYSSCGSSFTDGQRLSIVVERGGPRWVYPTCANAVLNLPDAPAFTGVAPGPDAAEYRLPGPPLSWFLALLQPQSVVIGAVLIVIGVAVLGVAVALRRLRRARLSR
ncbi:hypothetical protein GCM10027289_13970 [Tsukamurella serpentis]